MTTKNVRVVGYLPPPAHEKLREYMREESLTESAAIVKIVQQFFDGGIGTKFPEAEKEKDDAMVAKRLRSMVEEHTAVGIAELKSDIVELKRRLAVLEQAVVSGKQRPFASSKTSQKQKPLTMLPPQSCADLARRLGVSTGTILEADQKGEVYFRDWSRRMDPTKRAWHKRGELFHPEPD